MAGNLGRLEHQSKRRVGRNVEVDIMDYVGFIPNVIHTTIHTNAYTFTRWNGHPTASTFSSTAEKCSLTQTNTRAMTNGLTTNPSICFLTWPWEATGAGKKELTKRFSPKPCALNMCACFSRTSRKMLS